MTIDSLETILKETEVKRMTTSKWKKVVVYADRHSSIADIPSDNIIKKYMMQNNKSITHVVDLGDGVDNPFMSDYAVDPSFVLSSQEEFDLYARHINEMSKIVPEATKIIIPGNHDKSRMDKAKRMNRGIASMRNMQYENVLKESILNDGGNLTNLKIAGQRYELKLTKDYSVCFSHGDQRLDPNMKSGMTGARRTAMEYPFEGDIIWGHGHEYKQFPRKFKGYFAIQLDMMADISEMESHYVGWHPYSNGFGVIHYNTKENTRFFQHIPIVDGLAVIDGKVYNGNVKKQSSTKSVLL